MCGPQSKRKTKPRIKQLSIAGALIAAEIDRLQRSEGLLWYEQKQLQEAERCKKKK
jgi:hypothetical protein